MRKTFRLFAGCLVAFLGIELALPFSGYGQPMQLGAEFRVNSYTTEDQRNVAISSEADGDFVVVWASRRQDDGIDFGVIGQRYRSSGQALGSEFQVNSLTTSDQFRPAVSTDADGDFVVVWQGYEQDGDFLQVFGQRFRSSGQARGSEFHVSSHTSEYEMNASVSSEPDGDFVVVWQRTSSEDDRSGVFGQRYSSSGMRRGTEFQVNDSSADITSRPKVGSALDGDFVVVWQRGYPISSRAAVFAKRFQSNGAALGTEFLVQASTSLSASGPSISVAGDGAFVVVWNADGGHDSGFDVAARRFGSDGQPLSSQLIVNTNTIFAQGAPSVSVDTDGNFVIAWTSQYQDGSYDGVFGQAFRSTGMAVGSELRVNSYTLGNQKNAAVSGDASGDFVVVWESYNQDGSGQGIFGQRFASHALPVALGSSVLEGRMELLIPVFALTAAHLWRSGRRARRRLG